MAMDMMEFMVTKQSYLRGTSGAGSMESCREVVLKLIRFCKLIE